MVLSALNLLLSDVQGAAQKSIANFDNLTVDKYFLYILLGYEVYVLVKEHKSVHNRQLTIAGAAVFFGSCIGTVLTGHICFAATGESYMPQILTMSASAGLFLLLVTAVKPRHTKLWNYLGCRTLYIYMVHIIVIFSCEQVWGDFFWKMFGSCQNVLWQLAYGIVYGTIIFLISLLLGNLFRFIYEKLLLGMALKATKSIFDRQKGIR
jgi:fucose 4-O-acetylase-like acetyltransferase